MKGRGVIYNIFDALNFEIRGSARAGKNINTSDVTIPFEEGH